MRIKIKKTTILYGFFLTLYYRPASYILGNNVDNLCLLLICLLTLCFFLDAVLKFGKGVYHPTDTTVWLIIFFGWCMLGSTCINYFISGNVSLDNAITTFLCELGIIIATDMCLEINPGHYLKLFVFIGGFFSTINAVTMFLYGHKGGLNPTVELEGRELSNNYFYFGEDNATFFLVWPVLVLTWIYYFRYKRTKRMMIWSIIFTVISTTSYIYMWSVNNMIGCVMTIGLIIYYWRRTIKNKPVSKVSSVISKFNIGWILAIIFNYLLVIEQIFLRFSDFIVNTLHKSPTLGGRVPIWQNCLIYIKNQPLIGFGYETRSVTLSKIILSHAHNIILEILYRGGIIGMIFFVMAMLSLGKKVKKIQKNTLVMILAWCVVLFIFLSAIEYVFYRYPYIVVFVLLGRCNILCGKKERDGDIRNGAIQRT